MTTSPSAFRPVVAWGPLVYISRAVSPRVFRFSARHMPAPRSAQSPLPLDVAVVTQPNQCRPSLIESVGFVNSIDKSIIGRILAQ
jgi:hypothetical protein